ncbi:MAG: endolytic transglycosylase MltG, partial [Proteobacteria bacterium]|nr:endolytic transglycosylase MltG [Pseudomonadota bacterium]
MPTHLLRNRLIYFVIGLVFLIGVFLFVGFGYYLSTPAEKGGDDQVFFVRDGSTLNEVTSELESKRIITGKRLFLLWARLMGYSRSIKAGEYRLSSAMPPLKILEILSKGAVITHPVTIPEGYTIKQIGELLEEKGLVKNEEFLAITGDLDVAKRYGISGQSLEGYLYPDTYQFDRGLSPMSVVEVIVKHFWEVIGPLREKIEQSGMTIEEVITLASIVEKETGRAEERPIIASVFLNRL